MSSSALVNRLINATLQSDIKAKPTFQMPWELPSRPTQAMEVACFVTLLALRSTQSKSEELFIY